jgi:hypothetical protein
MSCLNFHWCILVCSQSLIAKQGDMVTCTRLLDLAERKFPVGTDTAVSWLVTKHHILHQQAVYRMDFLEGVCMSVCAYACLCVCSCV